MFGRIIDVMFILIITYLLVANAEGFSKVITVVASGTSRLVQVLQGNVSAGSGT